MLSGVKCAKLSWLTAFQMEFRREMNQGPVYLLLKGSRTLKLEAAKDQGSRLTSSSSMSRMNSIRTWFPLSSLQRRVLDSNSRRAEIPLRRL